MVRTLLFSVSARVSAAAAIQRGGAFATNRAAGQIARRFTFKLILIFEVSARRFHRILSRNSTIDFACFGD
jgi:hypothetical protein